MDPIRQYFDLIQRIDENAKRLSEIHGVDITCRPGCTGCCVNLTVFPVEFYAIRQAITDAGITLGAGSFDPSAACGFLDDDLCRIYPFRPIICRTHGLPILYLDDTSGEYTWEVSFCELNFTAHDNLEFTEDRLLNIEDINTELSRINRNFLARHNENAEIQPPRIPLKVLCTVLP